jgi:hypothetical protein
MLPIDKPTVSLTFGGTVAGGVPWDCRLWFSPLDTGADITNVNRGVLENAAAAIGPLWGAIAPFNSPDTALTSLTARGYRAGQTATRVQNFASLGDTHVGTGGGSGALSQAVVASLYTAIAGRSGRGRLYWPATAGLPAGHGFSDAQCQSLADALAAFMVAVSNDVAEPLEGNPVGVVRSEVLGTANQIVSVVVNTRPDRQEHRERHLVTTAHSAGVAY